MLQEVAIIGARRIELDSGIEDIHKTLCCNTFNAGQALFVDSALSLETISTLITNLCTDYCSTTAQKLKVFSTQILNTLKYFSWSQVKYDGQNSTITSLKINRQRQYL